MVQGKVVISTREEGHQKIIKRPGNVSNVAEDYTEYRKLLDENLRKPRPLEPDIATLSEHMSAGKNFQINSRETKASKNEKLSPKTKLLMAKLRELTCIKTQNHIGMRQLNKKKSKAVWKDIRKQY